MKKIGIVGMGHVGLTLALTLASAGFEVLGVEREEKIVEDLNKGKPHFYEKSLQPLLKKHLQNNSLRVATKIEEKQEAYIICVGTPIDESIKRVILQPLIRAAEEVLDWVEDGDLVILRSTVPVGTTRNVILPALLKKLKNFYFAYCPERTMEGKALSELKELPQIVAGIDKQSEDKAIEIFSNVTPTIIRVEALEAAELIKLVDNAWRDLIFAFANEVALLSEEYGLEGFKLIKAANLGYPRNSIPIPGFVGGACLSKDPYILIESGLDKGYETKFSLLARTINEGLIGYTAEKIKEKLATLGKDIGGAKIFILGVAFKGEPEVDDTRGSPSIALARYLSRNYNCAEIYGHDFRVPYEEIERSGIKPCSLKEGFKGADCIILMTTHRLYYDLNIGEFLNFVNKPAVFFDGWRVFDREDVETIEGIIYTGIATK